MHAPGLAPTADARMLRRFKRTRLCLPDDGLDDAARMDLGALAVRFRQSCTQAMNERMISRAASVLTADRLIMANLS
jgi:hypothetical protein